MGIREIPGSLGFHQRIKLTGPFAGCFADLSIILKKIFTIIIGLGIAFKEMHNYNRLT